MHLGAKIIDAAAIVRAEEIHAGQRCKSDLLDLHARKQRRLDVVDRGLAWPDRETIGRGCALAVEQRMHDDRICALGRPLDPEGTEVGKFLALGIGGVERKSAGREPIGEVLGHGPEIARTKKDADLVEIVGAVDRAVNAKAREAEILLDVGSALHLDACFGEGGRDSSREGVEIRPRVPEVDDAPAVVDRARRVEDEALRTVALRVDLVVPGVELVLTHPGELDADADRHGRPPLA